MCEFKKGDKVICIKKDNHPELIKIRFMKLKNQTVISFTLKVVNMDILLFYLEKNVNIAKMMDIIIVIKA